MQLTKDQSQIMVHAKKLGVYGFSLEQMSELTKFDYNKIQEGADELTSLGLLEKLTVNFYVYVDQTTVATSS